MIAFGFEKTIYLSLGPFSKQFLRGCSLIRQNIRLQKTELSVCTKMCFASLKHIKTLSDFTGIRVLGVFHVEETEGSGFKSQQPHQTKQLNSNGGN